MRILVTGGAGFIGSNIVNRLVDKNEVLIVDNLSTGILENINKDAYFHQVDICSEDLRKSFEWFRPEIVMHYAAQTSVQNSIDNPVYDARVNAVGTLNLLENCKNYCVRKFIYASSAAVYGIPSHLPIDENHPLFPISPYGVSKLAGEYYVKLYGDLYNMDYLIFRFSNVFGLKHPRANRKDVVSIFLDCLKNDEAPVIYGDENDTRDYIYIKDIVDANVRAVDSNIDGIFNLSTSIPTTVTNLLFEICRNYNREAEYYRKKERPGNIKHSCLSNKKVASILKWKPQYTLEEALKEMAIEGENIKYI